jgi:hypothetical protein
MLYIVSLIAVAIFGFLMPRIGMRIVKDVCPSFFSRLSCLLTLGLADALEGHDHDLWSEDGEPLEQEMLSGLIKASLLFSFIFTATFVLAGGGYFGAIVVALLTSLLPTAGAGLVLIAVGHLMLQLRVVFCRADPSRSVGFFDSSESSEPLPYSLADRAYDYVQDTREAFAQDPVGFFAFVDRAYDRARAWIVAFWQARVRSR